MPLHKRMFLYGGVAALAAFALAWTAGQTLTGGSALVLAFGLLAVYFQLSPQAEHHRIYVLGVHADNLGPVLPGALHIVG